VPRYLDDEIPSRAMSRKHYVVNRAKPVDMPYKVDDIEGKK